MSSEEALADRLRRALYVYKAEERELDHADEDELVEEALQELEDTMDQFLEGEINFATVKYRLDDAFVHWLRFPSSGSDRCSERSYSRGRR